jgi:protein-disulfide isomerase
MALALTRRRVLTVALAAAALPVATGAQQTHAIVENVMGSPDAPVTVIEYAMFTCPHCAAFHKDVLPQLKENYIDTGKVRLVFREVYFNRPSLWAAMIARCAPADRYFGVVDLLFDTQRDWASADSDEALVAKLYGVGRQAGLTDDEMQACLTDRGFAEALVADFQKNAEADGIEATPSFVIDGETLTNMPYDDFAERLAAELAG